MIKNHYSENTPSCTLSVGERIRELRKTKGLKQSWVALCSQMSSAQLCHIEKAKGQPSLRTLQRIANTLGISVTALLGETKSDNYVDEHHQINTTKGDLLSSDKLDSIDVDTNSEPLFTVQDTVGSHHYSADLSNIDAIDPITQMRYVHDPMESNFDRKTKKIMKQEIDKILAAEKEMGHIFGFSPIIPLSYPAAVNSGTLLAREVRMSGGIGPAGIINPITFFEGKGIPVIEMKLPAGQDSWSLWDGEKRKAFIFIQKHTTVERKRFRAAYEMGYIIRYVSGNCCHPISDIKGSKTISRAFAASFLLPEEAVRELTYRLAIGIQDWNWELILYAKEKFGVSTETFLHRIEELRLITDSSKQIFLKQLTEHYEKCRRTGHTDIEPRLEKTICGYLGELQLRNITSSRNNNNRV